MKHPLAKNRIKYKPFRPKSYLSLTFYQILAIIVCARVKV